MWLIGMMGSGKTTVGRGAAGRIGVPFYDTDDLVVDISRMSINDIWDGVGEEGFRELERRAVAAVPVTGFLAAAGGGAVLDPDNREHMRQGAPIVWLRCAPNVLADRLESDGSRPLLAAPGVPAEERIAGILAERSDLYSDVASDIIDTDDRELDDVITDVISIWQR